MNVADEYLPLFADYFPPIVYTAPATSNPKLAARLRSLGDGLQKQIDAKRAPAIASQNYTARRARIADSMRREADYLEKIQYALYGLAGAHEYGLCPPVLAKVDNKKAVERLLVYNRWPYWEDSQNSLARVGITPDNIAEASRALSETNLPPDRREEHRRLQLELKARELVGQIPGFFPTPRAVVEQMVGQIWPIGAETILEPSAGSGAIADVIREKFPDAKLTVIEASPSLRDLLDAKGYSVAGDDCLQHQGSYRYILMNPPFESMQDVEHVQHCYTLLADDGRLVSIMSESPFFRNDRKAEDFREWLDLVGGWSIDLPAGAFKESGTGVKARIVVIDK